MSKVWNSFTAILSNHLSKKLEKKSLKEFLESLAESKDEIHELFTSKSRKSKKDPNAPKKPKSSYILFCSEKRNEIKKDNPELSATQITSRLGALWKECSEEDKKRYESLANEDKERYKTDMENYSGGESTSAKTKKVGPKRPRSAYMYFCQEKRTEVKDANPELSGKEITAELGKMWRKLSDNEKKPYMLKQNDDKKRYDTEKGTVIEEEDEDPNTENKKQSTTKRAEPKKENPKKQEQKTESKQPAKREEPKRPEPKREEPKKQEQKSQCKPSQNREKGFQTFSEEQRDEVLEEHPKWNSKQVEKELRKRWEELPEDEKAAYEFESAEDDVSDTDSSESELEDEDDE